MPDEKPKQVPLTNREIQVIIDLLMHSNPTAEQQNLVVNLVDKLWMMLRL